MKNGLSGNALKLIALLTMTIDHVGMLLFPKIRLLRIIGRLAMPLFAFMIAEGCRYTRNMPRYFGRIALVGLVCQVVSWFALKTLNMCIMVTFSMSVLLIAAIKNVMQRRNLLSYAGVALAAMLVFGVCVVLPKKVSGFSVDYGIMGVLVPVLIYLGHDEKWRLVLAAAGFGVLAARVGRSQAYSLLTLPLLAMYNGERGKWNIKWLFYLYYPAHLVVLYMLAAIL